VGYHERQSVRLLAAPLRIEQTFTPTEPVVFQDLVFPGGRPTDSRYRFDSYRATWYWRFAPSGKWSFRLGATLKVRSAEIGLSGDPGRSVKDDLGVVPLLYAYARYQATERFALELEADALAAPQGRAEDVSLKACTASPTASSWTSATGCSRRSRQRRGLHVRALPLRCGRRPRASLSGASPGRAFQGRPAGRE